MTVCLREYEGLFGSWAINSRCCLFSCPSVVARPISNFHSPLWMFYSCFLSLPKSFVHYCSTYIKNMVQNSSEGNPRKCGEDCTITVNWSCKSEEGNTRVIMCFIHVQLNATTVHNVADTISLPHHGICPKPKWESEVKIKIEMVLILLTTLQIPVWGKEIVCAAIHRHCDFKAPPLYQRFVYK